MTQQLHILSPTEIEAASRALITARKTNLGIEIQMPVIYPTGSTVTVVVTVQGGEYLIHDAGMGAMALTSSGITLSKTLEERLSALAKHYGCDFIGGRMSRRCTPPQVALAALMVANASRTVGDQALDQKRAIIYLTQLTPTDSSGQRQADTIHQMPAPGLDFCVLARLIPEAIRHRLAHEMALGLDEPLTVDLYTEAVADLLAEISRHGWEIRPPVCAPHSSGNGDYCSLPESTLAGLQVSGDPDSGK